MTRICVDGVDYVVLVRKPGGSMSDFDPDKPYAVKYDGLAEGKGVFMTSNRNEFVLAIHEIERRFFGSHRIQEEEKEAEETQEGHI